MAIDAIFGHLRNLSMLRLEFTLFEVVLGLTFNATIHLVGRIKLTKILANLFIFITLIVSI